MLGHEKVCQILRRHTLPIDSAVWFTREGGCFTINCFKSDYSRLYYFKTLQHGILGLWSGLL